MPQGPTLLSRSSQSWLRLSGGRYVGPILPGSLADLLAGGNMARRDGNGVGGNGSGNAISRIGGVSNGGGMALKGKKVGAPGGEARVQV